MLWRLLSLHLASKYTVTTVVRTALKKKKKVRPGRTDCGGRDDDSVQIVGYEETDASPVIK